MLKQAGRKVHFEDKMKKEKRKKGKKERDKTPRNLMLGVRLVLTEIKRICIQIRIRRELPIGQRSQINKLQIGKKKRKVQENFLLLRSRNREILQNVCQGLLQKGWYTKLFSVLPMVLALVL